MAIVPSGKMRVMKTQKFANPLSQGFGDDVSINQNIPQFETEDSMDEDISPEITPFETLKIRTFQKNLNIKAFI